jgi:hypothetical protein
MTHPLHAPIEAFFAAYAARFNAALADPPHDDVEGTAAAFARFFVEASPLGVNGGPNNEAFRAMIPQGNAFYRAIGTKSMAIRGLEIQPIDDLHAMVRVHWDSRYARPDGAEVAIPFDVVYFVQVLDGTPRIFAYITGDEQRVLREHGLLPPDEA